jgi:hypothetical protein
MMKWGEKKENRMVSFICSNLISLLFNATSSNVVQSRITYYQSLQNKRFTDRDCVHFKYNKTLASKDSERSRKTRRIGYVLNGIRQFDLQDSKRNWKALKYNVTFGSLFPGSSGKTFSKFSLCWRILLEDYMFTKLAEEIDPGIEPKPTILPQAACSIFLGAR